MVEAKSRVDAKTVPLLVERLDPARPAILSAGYLSPQARARLTGAGVSFVDATGNLRVVLDEPGLAVLADGESRDP